MWAVVTGFCELQLWVLLGLLPATAGGLIAWLWAGLAAMTLVAGLIALRRHPDAGALLLGLVLPVTLIPPFVFGRERVEILAEPLVQALTGASLALGLVAIVLARREALAPPPRATELAALPGTGARRRHGHTRLTTLLFAALWLALPARALIDPSLLDGPLAAQDPIRARQTLILIAWLAASVVAFGALLPAAAAGPTIERRAVLPHVLAGGVLFAVWGLLVGLGA